MDIGHHQRLLTIKKVKELIKMTRNRETFRAIVNPQPAWRN